jgi:hypothetical protein
MVTYQRATVTSVDDIQAIADRAGSHFFDRDTMRFFSSRVLEGVYPALSNGESRWESREGAKFAFVTSEANEWEGRKYTVRILTLESRDGRPHVDIAALDDAYRLDTPAQAKRAAREWAASN